MLLPNAESPLPAGTAPSVKHSPDQSQSSPGQSLLHPSTFILSAPTELVFRANPTISTTLAQQICSGGGIRRDTESMYSTPTAMQYSGSGEYDGGYATGRGGHETPFGESAAGFVPENAAFQRDAFEALINGDLPPSHSLIGDGQQLTPQIIDTFIRVDAKLKVSFLGPRHAGKYTADDQKQFNLLVKEGDQFARKMLDEEIALLLSSLSSPSPMQFDYDAALSGAGNGWQLSPPRSSAQHYSNRLPSEPTSASTANFSIATSGGGPGPHNLSRPHPGLVRRGSSDRSQDQHASPHPWARRSTDSSRDGGVAGSREEHMRDEDSDERREHDFGSV